MTYDRETVETILREAWASVEASEVPASVQQEAFAKAVDLLASRTRRDELGPDRQREEAGDEDDAKPSNRMKKIASAIGVDEDKLEYIYDLEEDDVLLITPRSRLSSGDAAATREVALLYCAARQSAGYDATHTSVNDIRRKADDMGVLDTSNFAETVKDIEGLSHRGSGRNREFKVTRHGYEEAAKVVGRVANAS
jgi:hypothetical protein